MIPLIPSITAQKSAVIVFLEPEVVLESFACK